MRLKGVFSCSGVAAPGSHSLQVEVPEFLFVFPYCEQKKAKAKDKLVERVIESQPSFFIASKYLDISIFRNTVVECLCRYCCC